MNELRYISYFFAIAISLVLSTTKSTAENKIRQQETDGLAMPEYNIIHNNWDDSIIVELKHENPNALIYANINGGKVKSISMVVNTIRLPYWRRYDKIVTWAEYNGSSSEELIITLTDNVYENDHGLTPGGISTGTDTNYGNNDIVRDIFTTFILYSEANWQINAGEQQVRIDEDRIPSEVIGDPNGPIDIYSAGATVGALFFGKAEQDNVKRAYIQSVNKIVFPAVVDLHIQADETSVVNQRLAIRISADGMTWMSVDTLNTEQLKPIRRYEVKCDYQGEAFLRIESVTEPATQCQTWIYDISVLLLRKTTDYLPQVDGKKQAVSVKYYNILGMECTTPPHGQICIEETRYSDSSESSRLIMRR